MAYIPILFNTEMVQAIQAGRKTQTRRIMKLKYKENEAGFQILTNKHDGSFAYAEYYDEDENPTRLITPPCMPGSILWVRETWRPIEASSAGWCRIEYKAGGTEDFKKVIAVPKYQEPWHPSIHMPKEAARIFLRVKDVRVERLLDITEEDAVREGCYAGYKSPPTLLSDPNETYVNTAKDHFCFVWEATVNPADWDVYGINGNPWVWVIEFERCEKPEGWH